MTGVQFFPQILQPGQVIGRLNADPGPAEAISIAQLFAAMTSAVTVIVTANSYTVLAGDQVVVFNKVVAAASTIQLPSVYLRKGQALDIFDFSGNSGPITITPFGTETINGVASWQIASGASVHLVPNTAIPGWMVSNPSPSGNKGTSLLDFGAFPGAPETLLVITGQTNIVAGSVVDAWLSPKDTADHLSDDHYMDGPQVFAGTIVPGVGFTIYGVTPIGYGTDRMAWGKWNVNWQWV